MEPPKGPQTGCAFYPILSVGESVRVCVCVRVWERVTSLMFITASFNQTQWRCASQSTCFYNAMVYVSINAPVIFPHVFSKLRLEPLNYLFIFQFRGVLTLTPSIDLCSGTSYLCCTFACCSAFDGLSGLIPGMKSLSPLSNVSLCRVSGRKTSVGESALKGISGGACIFSLVPCASLCCVLLVSLSAQGYRLTGTHFLSQRNVVWGLSDPSSPQKWQCAVYRYIKWNSSKVCLCSIFRRLRGNIEVQTGSLCIVIHLMSRQKTLLWVEKHNSSADVLPAIGCTGINAL